MNSLLLAVILGLVLQPSAPVQTSEVVITGPSGEQRITATDLAALPRVTLTIDDHDTKATFEGVELRHLLEKVGAPLGETLRGKDLTRYVVVEAADGYRVLFALAELDAGFSDTRVILADKQAGKPLDAKVGPFRIVAEGDKRMGRSARQVVRIALGAAEPR
ncbi:MAG TPA: molybdopterin-dependent oxidoreductase [Vicinamibacterales bacterium]